MARKSNVIRCSRQDFIDCVNGDLMIRNREGVITHCGDRAWDAVCAAEHGEKVILTVGGKDFSYVLGHKEFKIK